MGWDIKVDLHPCSSISTYGKCLNGNTNSGHKPRKGAAEAKEILIGLDDDERPDPTAGVRAELNNREGAPPKPGVYNNNKNWGSAKAASRPSPCFVTRPRGDGKASQRGSLEETPGPNHYNPRHALTHGATPQYSVPKTNFKSRAVREDASEATDSPQRPKSAQRADKTPSTEKTPKAGKGGKGSKSAHRMLPRNDRVCNTLSPWIKGQGAAGSSFQSISRKPLFEGSVTELVETAHNPGRPRSACFVRMKSTITRAQKNKHTHDGHGYGHYTKHLNYNKDIHRQNHEVVHPKAATSVRMNQMVNREQSAGSRQQDWREKVAQQESNPALQSLGMPQAAWGSKNGALGCTGEVLTRRKTPSASLSQQSRAQHSKVGHTGSTEQSTDVMYDLSSSIIAENTVVSYQNMQARTTVMSKDTEGADEMYDYVRPSSVAGPEFSKTPSREQRTKAGHGVTITPTDTITDPQKLMAHSIGSKVHSINFGKATSREAVQLSLPMKYQDQLPNGHPIREIGEMLKSPVRGQPPYVPDIGKMPKRDICKKEDKRKGKNGRFGG